MKIKDMNKKQKEKVKKIYHSKRCWGTRSCCECLLYSPKEVNGLTCVALNMGKYPEFKIDMRRVR